MSHGGNPPDGRGFKKRRRRTMPTIILEARGPSIDDGAIVPSAVFAQIVIRCVWLLRLLPPSGLSRPEKVGIRFPLLQRSKPGSNLLWRGGNFRMCDWT